jgi:hypothetical protein
MQREAESKKKAEIKNRSKMEVKTLDIDDILQGESAKPRYNHLSRFRDAPCCYVAVILLFLFY